jgi:hypothetical protein
MFCASQPDFFASQLGKPAPLFEEPAVTTN